MSISAVMSCLVSFRTTLVIRKHIVGWLSIRLRSERTGLLRPGRPSFHESHVQQQQREVAVVACCTGGLVRIVSAVDFLAWREVQRAVGKRRSTVCWGSQSHSPQPRLAPATWSQYRTPRRHLVRRPRFQLPRYPETSDVCRSPFADLGLSEDECGSTDSGLSASTYRLSQMSALECLNGAWTQSWSARLVTAILRCSSRPS
jgi:hypothetical protein